MIMMYIISHEYVYHLWHLCTTTSDYFGDDYLMPSVHLCDTISDTYVILSATDICVITSVTPKVYSYVLVMQNVVDTCAIAPVTPSVHIRVLMMQILVATCVIPPPMIPKVYTCVWCRFLLTHVLYFQWQRGYNYIVHVRLQTLFHNSPKVQ